MFLYLIVGVMIFQEVMMVTAQQHTQHYLEPLCEEQRYGIVRIYQRVQIRKTKSFQMMQSGRFTFPSYVLECFLKHPISVTT